MKTRISLFLLTIFLVIFGCQHDSLRVDDPSQGGGSGGSGNEEPCDPSTVYFKNTIGPMLVANCSISGCHDSATASDGVILDSYENVIATADVEAGDPSESDLYEVLVETDEDKKMPPPNSGISLSTAQIQAVYDWILQGAKNNECTDDNCETDNMSFANNIFTIVQNKCLGCHSGNNPQGGILLNNYNNIKQRVDDGSFLGAIEHQASYTPMPYQQDKLPQCEIDKIKSWINEGALNN